MKKLFILILLSSMFAACTKTNEIDSIVVQKEADLSKEETIFMDELKSRMERVSFEGRTVLDPVNLQNEFEYLGQNVQSTISQVNQLEIEMPSTSKDDYVNRFESTFVSNVEDFSFLESLNVNSPFYSELSEFILLIAKQEDLFLSVEQLKILESALLQSTLLSELEKQGLVKMTTILKYFRYEIASQGVVVGSITIGPDDRGFWDCFDRTFDRKAQQNLSVLANNHSPVAMAGAWVGLPGTLGWGVGDALYHGVVDCW